MGMDPSPAFLYIWKLWKAAGAARKKSARMGAGRENGGRRGFASRMGTVRGERGTGAGLCPWMGVRTDAAVRSRFAP